MSIFYKHPPIVTYRGKSNPPGYKGHVPIEQRAGGGSEHPAGTPPAAPERGLTPEPAWKKHPRPSRPEPAPRILSFVEFCGEAYKLLTELTHLLQVARRGIGVAEIPVAKLPPSALTPEGVVYDGRVYEIPKNLRRRLQPSEDFLIPGEWDVSKFHVWYKEMRKQYQEYVLDYTESLTKEKSL